MESIAFKLHVDYNKRVANTNPVSYYVVVTMDEEKLIKLYQVRISESEMEAIRKLPKRQRLLLNEDVRTLIRKRTKLIPR